MYFFVKNSIILNYLGVLKMSKKKNKNNNQKNISKNNNQKTTNNKVEGIKKTNTDSENIEDVTSVNNEASNILVEENTKKDNVKKEEKSNNKEESSKNTVANEIKKTSVNIDGKADNKSDNISDKKASESSSESNLKNNKPTDNKVEDFEQPKIQNDSNSKKIIIISVIIGIVLLIVLLFSTIFALININKNTIINGISIKGIDVSNMTKEDANKKVSDILSEKLSKEIKFNHNDSSVSLFPEQFSVSFDIPGAVDTAYSKGRNGNIFANNFEILSSMFFKTNIGPSFSFSEDSLNSLIKEMENNFEDRLVEPSYYVEGNNLIITKGKDGVIISSDQLKTEIGYIINNLECNTTTIDVPVISKTAGKIDLEKIHSEIYKAPQDAYYTKDPFVVHPHSDGVDFSISMEEANNLLNGPDESISIPLKVLSPSVTTNQIGDEAFPDLLGNYSTTYSTRNANRSTNIRLASSKINGIVVMPGETFSYNKTVGKRTAAAGFKSAAVYSGGEVTTGIGGGICQVSSTLYNAVLYANLEIVERHNHGFNTGYVPAGRDATVSWGGPDFVFKNNRDYPVRVVCNGAGGTITCKIFGLKSNNEYDVEIQSYVTQSIGYRTINQNDPSLPAGTTKVVQSGSNGCRSVAYRILKQNGQVVSKTLLSTDTYNPHNKIVAVGTQQ